MMIDALTQGAIAFIKIGTRAVFVIAVILSFSALLMTSINLISVAINGSVLADIGAMIQVWLPFNLNAMTSWLFLTSALYFAYRLAIYISTLVNGIIGNY